MTAQLEHRNDPETLREVYADPRAVRARIEQLRAEIRDAPDEIAGTARRRLEAEK